MIDKNRACRYLMRIGPTYPGLLDDTEGDDKISTAQYQCLKTTSAVGSDHNTATPEQCSRGRSCFKEF
jgi:hypothetical protein